MNSEWEKEYTERLGILINSISEKLGDPPNLELYRTPDSFGIDCIDFDVDFVAFLFKREEFETGSLEEHFTRVEKKILNHLLPAKRRKDPGAKEQL